MCIVMAKFHRFVRKLCIANSLPQVPHEVMHWVMNSYGSVGVIKAAELSEIYRYLVANAVRLVTTTL